MLDNIAFNYLIKKIKEKEFISLYDYFEITQFHDEFGFYNVNKPIIELEKATISKDSQNTEIQNSANDLGHFITSPEISQIFSEIFSIFLVNYIFKNFPHDKDINICELGPGNGKLMQSFQNIAQKFLQNYQIQNYYFIEKNSYFIEQQKKVNFPFPIKSCAQIDELHCGNYVFFANEFIDCFPIKSYIFKNKNWHEEIVKFDGKKIHLTYDTQKIDVTKTFPIYFQEYIKNNPAKNNDIIQFQPYLPSFIKNLADKMHSDSVALLCDYGFKEMKYGSSLQSIYKHRKCSPLEYPFSSDLTSLVNFSYIEHLCHEFGLLFFGPINQNEFLHKNGGKLRLEMLIKKNANMASILFNQFNKLLQIGVDFDFIAITKNKNFTFDGSI